MTFDLFSRPPMRGKSLEAHLVGHLVEDGQSPQVRSLNDVDIVVESFGAMPPELARGFLFRHIHPHVPEGKTLVQLVDPGEALRIDIFRAYGATLARSESMDFPAGSLAVVALEDLAAWRNGARICWWFPTTRGMRMPRV